jgi:hypothetical protein
VTGAQDGRLSEAVNVITTPGGAKTLLFQEALNLDDSKELNETHVACVELAILEGV